MEDNAFDKLKSMVNSGNIPENLQQILSNISSSNKNANSSSNNSGISPEAINSLMSMLNSHSNDKSESTYLYLDGVEISKHAEQNNSGIDFETIMKFKTIMDKMNSKDDPRTKLLISLKPYLKDSRKSKVDQYIQFFKMSQVIDIFSKSNGDDKS